MTESLIKKTISDSGIYFISLALASLSAFISVPIYTRLFNPSEYGYLSLTLVTISLLSVFAYGPISASIVRFFPKFDGKENEREFYTTSFVITLLCTFAVSLFYCIGLLSLKTHVNPNLFELLAFSVLILIMMSFFNIFLSIFRIRQDSKQYGLFTVLNRYLSLFIGLYFVIILSQGVTGVLLGTFVTLFFLNIFVFIFYFKKKIKLNKKGVSTDIAHKIIWYGTPLIFSLLSQWILSVSDRYMIGFFRGSSEVGIYSIGYDLSFQSMSLLIMPFITALTPTIINAWERNRDEAEYTLQKLSRYFFMFSLPALIGFNSLSKPIISILTTPQYYGGQLIFPFVTMGAFFLGLYFLSYTGLIIHEKSRLIAKIITISAILNILLNLVLIPYYGFIGAGISTMIAYFATFVIADRISSKYLKWRPVTKPVIKIFFASVTMGIIVYSISTLVAISLLNLLLEILIGCIVYFSVLYMLRGVENEEINEVKAMIRNMREKV